MNKILAGFMFVLATLCTGCGDKITNVTNVTYVGSYYSCVGVWKHVDSTETSTITFNNNETWTQETISNSYPKSVGNGTYVQNEKVIKIFSSLGNYYCELVMTDSVTMNGSGTIFHKQ